MGYDIWFVIDAGGPKPVQIGDNSNYTSNVAPMWRKAGCDLAEMHDRPASEVRGPLWQALQAMRANPDEYRAMNPSNGWGNYDGCLQFLTGLWEACGRHPNAVMKVSR